MESEGKALEQETQLIGLQNMDTEEKGWDCQQINTLTLQRSSPENAELCMATCFCRGIRTEAESSSSQPCGFCSITLRGKANQA